MPIGIYAELLNEMPEKLAMGPRFLSDPNWVWQEKYNGERRLITKVGNTIEDFNRKGEPGKGLSPNIRRTLQQHPLNRFIIDTEYVGHEDRLYVLDTLMVGDDLLIGDEFPLATRLSFQHSNFGSFNKYVVPVIGVTKREDKLALVTRLKAEFAEGFVMRELTKEYRESNATGTLRYNFKVKFWKSLDAVVIGDSKKVVSGKLRDSVLLGLYLPDGRLHEICGATKKSWAQLKPGDVVEVKYLYGTEDLNIVQIDILRVRDDKRAHQCTIDQIEINKNFRKAAV